MIPSTIKLKNKPLPETPGVYLMKDARRKILYVGKAVSLKRRVAQYFTRPHGKHIEEMLLHLREIDFVETGTAIEALILEANLVAHYHPKYNILLQDDKTFLYLVITDEPFPKPLLIRGKDLQEGKKYKKVFGPYTSGPSLRAALELVRKVFPWSTCEPGQKRPCFYVHLKQCPGVCSGLIDRKSYGKIIRDLIKFFEGKKEFLLRQYKREMKIATKQLKFEEASALKKKVYFLEHIQDVAILKREDDFYSPPPGGGARGGGSGIFGRIEGYDISNISGTSSVGSMVVFENGATNKSEYRKFRIKMVKGSNDVASLQEVLFRRFRNTWRKPNVILIDGGLPQVQAAEHLLKSLNRHIPLIGIAKGSERKRNDLFFGSNTDEVFRMLCHEHHTLLEKVRDEAHRFAITYHRKLRGRTSLQ